jgi:nucleoside-diphosphate-sugar epimerase
MRIFLTGGTGVVGTRALPAVVAAGHDVTAVARTTAKAELVRTLGGQPTDVDLFDAEAVFAALKGFDAVVNLATNIPPLMRAAWPRAWATNDRLRSEASSHLVSGAIAAGATRFVQESICFPYQDNGAEWIDEDHPVDHVGPFAGARAAEVAADRFSVAGGTGVVLRFAQFYASDSGHVRTFNGLVRRRVNPFLGDPAAYTSFVHAEDAGAAVAAALGAAPGIFNIVDDEPVTKSEAGRIVAEALGVEPPRMLPRVMRNASPGSAKLLMRSQRVSHARFTAATGWTPAYPSIRGAWPTGATP